MRWAARAVEAGRVRTGIVALRTPPAAAIAGLAGCAEATLRETSASTVTVAGRGWRSAGVPSGAFAGSGPAAHAADGRISAKASSPWRRPRCRRKRRGAGPARCGARAVPGRWLRGRLLSAIGLRIFAQIVPAPRKRLAGSAFRPILPLHEGLGTLRRLSVKSDAVTERGHAAALDLATVRPRRHGTGLPRPGSRGTSPAGCPSACAMLRKLRPEGFSGRFPWSSRCGRQALRGSLS